MIARVVVAAALLLAITAQSPAPKAVRIGGTPAESYLGASYAQESGIFQKAGLVVDVQNQANGPTTATAVASGNLDVGIGSTITIASGVQRGIPFVIIAPAVMQSPKSPIGLMCVAKSSTIRGPKDLEGKTIALAGLKQAGDLGTRAWLVKGGADLNKIQFVETPFAAMGEGLERGTFAAANISEPALTVALRQNAVRCIADPFVAISSSFMVGVWYTTRDFAQKNPELVRKIAAAALEAGRWANAHHDETAAIVSRVTKVDVETVKGSNRPVFAEKMSVTDLQPELDAAFKFGFLTKPMTADELLWK
jgi:NitT/TauT family transport system substrate-binding protein